MSSSERISETSMRPDAGGGLQQAPDAGLTDVCGPDEKHTERARKKVLMVCYYYPPLIDVGCRRSTAFSKYFRKYGWEPYVISVKNPDSVYCTMGRELPPDGITPVYTFSLVNPYKYLGKLHAILSGILMLAGIRLKTNYFYHALCYPDIFFGWIPLTVLKGISMIRRHAIDFIYVSCSPYSSALIGVLLKKATGRPLILDYRDPFAIERPSFHESPQFRERINRRLQEFFLKNTDVFVVTSEETRQEYIRQYPGIEDRIHTVYNGFDPVSPPRAGRKKFDRFTIVYTGLFYNYGPHHEVYTEMFFKALRELKASGKINGSNFQFLYYGQDFRAIDGFAFDYGVSDLVVSRDRVSYAEVLEIISRSHLMLLRIVKLMISTKLYDGIPMNVPFLAIIPGGEVEGIIRKYSPGSYIITEEGSSADVAKAIEDAMEKYRSGQMPDNRIDEFLAAFSRESTSRAIMKAITETLGHRGVR